MSRLVAGFVSAVVALMLAGAAVLSGSRAASDRPAPGPASLQRPVSSLPAQAPASMSAVAPARRARVPAPSPGVPGSSADEQTALIRQYCVTCHNDRARAGGLSLAGYDAAAAPAHAATTEKMIRKLRAGMMPPAGAKRPDPAMLTALVEGLEARIDAAAAARPDPGWRPFQRLNRAEYARAIRDLLGLDIDVTAYLPADTISQGFDNVADSQTFSATLLEGYLRAAGRIAALAVGDPEAPAAEVNYKVSRTANQIRRVDGAPMGTRGGLSVVHTFPADGEYVFSVELHANACGVLFGGTAEDEQIEISIDGRRVAVLPIARLTEATTGLSLRTPPVHVRAGPQRVTAAFLLRAESPVLDLIAPIEHTLADTQIGVEYGITTVPHLRDLTIIGPRRVTGVSETESRRRIFTCRPTTPAEESACAATIVRRLAEEAFRGAVGAADFEGLMAFYEQGRRERDFEFGVTLALEAILASPQFLFRTEAAPAGAAPGRTYALAERDLATRLSFFLWASAPDAELLRLAREGRLSAQLGAQVRRMLADPRSEALATRFASQWLRLQDVDQILPDALLYPYYDHTLGQAFKRETELLFDSLVREDRSILDLLTADYTFVNERIARHYGIPNVTGSHFRRVALPDEHRRGILGHGSILTLTSAADRTSPVMRGKWVMEVLLGSPPPPPPPNVPELESESAAHDGRLLTLRERLEQHRANPACTSCHRVIDPIGLALENFDVTGRWRIKDAGLPVDPVGELYDGTPLDGPAGLRRALLKHKDAFLLSFTEHLMTYALGRRVETADMPTVRRIIREAAAREYRISAFVQALVESPVFRMSRMPAPAATAEGGAGGGRR